MQLSNYIDSITRAQSCLEEREQDFLFTLLDSFEELHQMRRETRSEQLFWNQFWQAWDFPKLLDARQKALEDMADDKYFHHIKESRSIYRNFETAVANDLYRFRRQILIELDMAPPTTFRAIYFYCQAIIQDLYINHGIDSKYIPILTLSSEKIFASPVAEDPNEKEVNDLIRNVNDTIKKRKEELKTEKRRRKKRKKRKSSQAKGKSVGTQSFTKIITRK